MAKQQLHIRASKLLLENLTFLQKRWGTNQAETIELALDRVYNQEFLQQQENNMFYTLTHENGNGAKFQVGIRPIEHIWPNVKLGETENTSPYWAISSENKNILGHELPQQVKDFVREWANDFAQQWQEKIDQAEGDLDEQADLLAEYFNDFLPELNLALSQKFPPSERQIEISRLMYDRRNKNEN